MEPLARLALDGAYEATLLAAVLEASGATGACGRGVALLTFLGGGVFGNKDEWIDAAMARAVVRVRERGIALRVVVAHYGRVDDARKARIGAAIRAEENASKARKATASKPVPPNQTSQAATKAANRESKKAPTIVPRDKNPTSKPMKSNSNVGGTGATKAKAKKPVNAPKKAQKPRADGKERNQKDICINAPSTPQSSTQPKKATPKKAQAPKNAKVVTPQKATPKAKTTTTKAKATKKVEHAKAPKAKTPNAKAPKKVEKAKAPKAKTPTATAPKKVENAKASKAKTTTTKANATKKVEKAKAPKAKTITPTAKAATPNATAPKKVEKANTKAATPEAKAAAPNKKAPKFNVLCNEEQEYNTKTGKCIKKCTIGKARNPKGNCVNIPCTKRRVNKPTTRQPQT